MSESIVKSIRKKIEELKNLRMWVGVYTKADKTEVSKIIEMAVRLKSSLEGVEHDA